MNILLVNDDGINSDGLRALHAALAARGHKVTAAAPIRQQSAVSRCLTVFEPLRAEKIETENFCGMGVHGTPADCVKLALAEFVDEAPDLVISGINEGRNVGPDINYSGTVAAAAEGAHAGLPSIAFSHDSRQKTPELPAIARHAAQLAEEIMAKNPLPGVVVNINYPNIPLEQMRGPAVCMQAPSIWRNVYKKCDDPRGWPYWWFAGKLDNSATPEDADIPMLNSGHITITPLKFEYTDHDNMDCLRGMFTRGQKD